MSMLRESGVGGVLTSANLQVSKWTQTLYEQEDKLRQESYRIMALWQVACDKVKTLSVRKGYSTAKNMERRRLLTLAEREKTGVQKKAASLNGLAEALARRVHESETKDVIVHIFGLFQDCETVELPSETLKLALRCGYLLRMVEATVPSVDGSKSYVEHHWSAPVIALSNTVALPDTVVSTQWPTRIDIVADGVPVCLWFFPDRNWASELLREGGALPALLEKAA